VTFYQLYSGNFGNGKKGEDLDPTRGHLQKQIDEQ